MRKLVWTCIAVLVAFVSPSSVLAQVSFSTAANLNLPINDDAYNGTLGSMACATVVVGGSSTVRGVSVLVYLNHTWVGDLTLKLISPSNTVVTLMSRPGVVEAADDGSGVSGESSNISSAFPVTFVDGGPKSAELMGNTLTSSQVVCRDDSACSYAPANGAAAPGTLAAFVGQPMAGNWIFCAGDSGLGDVGAIMQVRLTFVSGLLQVDPASTDFGVTLVGNTSAEQFVTLTNNGNATLSLDNISVALSPFARTGTGTCGNSLPRVLAVAESCTLSYTFAPTTGASSTQTFVVETDGGGDPGFELTGTGTLTDAVFQDGFE